MVTFKVTEVIKEAWENVKRNWKFLVSVTLVYFAIILVLGAGGGKDGFPKTVLSICSNIIQVLFSIGMIKVSLLILNGSSPSTSDFKTDWQTFWRVVWGGIITGFFVVIGLILLIVPGIIVAMRLHMTTYFIVDKKMPSWLAVKESWKVTHGYVWKLIGLSLMLILVVLVSLIPLGLGLLVSLPLTIIAMTIVYKKLSSVSEPEVVVENIPTVS